MAISTNLKQRAAELREDAVDAMRDAVGAKWRALKTAAAAPAPVSGEPRFRSSVRAGDATTQAEALVIQCNSHAYLAPTQDFLKNGLGLTAYDLVSIPGGAQWLALPDLLPKHHKVARGMTEFLLRAHKVPRIILIAHAGCSAYATDGALATLAHLGTGRTPGQIQIEQLRAAGRSLQEEFGVPVELYYAAAGGEGTDFHRLALDPERTR